MKAQEQQLSLFTPTVFVPQGGGEFLVKAGRPIEKLTPQQFGQAVGLSADSIYRHIDEGRSIPERFVEYVGPRKILIHAEAVEHFKTYWRNARS